jgi:CheY-like chemotaxis protein
MRTPCLRGTRYSRNWPWARERSATRRSAHCRKCQTATASPAEPGDLPTGQVLDGQRPDVLVSDIGLPEEDGYALVRQIRRHEAAHGGFLPAIALTGFARAEDRARILAAGFRAHVSKPVDPTALTAAIAAVARAPTATGDRAVAGDHHSVPVVSQRGSDRDNPGAMSARLTPVR